MMLTIAEMMLTTTKKMIATPKTMITTTETGLVRANDHSLQQTTKSLTKKSKTMNTKNKKTIYQTTNQNKMKNNTIIIKLMLFGLFFQITYNINSQTIGNDTIIQVFNMVPQINSKHDTTIQVVFPPSYYKYEKILMHYSLNQPPAGWDPWDRIAYVRVIKNNDTFEIGRIMTPYSKACGWTIDVTDYRPLLTDTALINSFILFWASNNKGYLVSISFEFIGGNPTKEAYKVVNLWGNDVFHRWEYGNIYNPISNYLPPYTLVIDSLADSVKVRITTTGHGQGNTHNAAEFSIKTHSLIVNGNAFSHQLWRNDCASNPCSPQSGTWQYNRAGWCPGADVRPWIVDITPVVTPGYTAQLQYAIQEYTNYCSPSHPDCVSGITCPDCNYNSTGHTMPWYLMQSQIIYYKNLNLTNIKENNLLNNNNISIYPNPTNDKLNIAIKNFNSQKIIELKILDVFGKVVYETQLVKNISEIDLNHLPKGIYFAKIIEINKIDGTPSVFITKKIIKQ